jgi:hypothetical protein
MKPPQTSQLAALQGPQGFHFAELATQPFFVVRVIAPVKRPARGRRPRRAFGASPRSNSVIGRVHYHIEKELQESGLPWV